MPSLLSICLLSFKFNLQASLTLNLRWQKKSISSPMSRMCQNNVEGENGGRNWQCGLRLVELVMPNFVYILHSPYFLVKKSSVEFRLKTLVQLFCFQVFADLVSCFWL